MKVLDDQKVPDSAKVKQAVSLIVKILHITDYRRPISQRYLVLVQNPTSAKVRIMEMKGEVKEVADSAGAA